MITWTLIALVLWLCVGAAFAIRLLWLDHRNGHELNTMICVGVVIVFSVYWPLLLGIGEHWPEPRDDGKERGNQD